MTSRSYVRLQAITSHLTDSAGLTGQSTSASSSLDSLYRFIEGQFVKSKSDLEFILKNLLSEMRDGLQPNSQSSLKMIPTFVTKLPHGKEKGLAYAIDMGGSNLRILRVQLDGNGGVDVKGSSAIQAEIPPLIQQSSADVLFDFIADTILQFIKQDQVKLGFTFSFPVNQLTLNSGILIKWTKGFTAKEVVNKDVVGLLNKAMKKMGVTATVNVLMNDTVGTLLTGSYQQVNEDVCIGLILGTGSNTCYMEKTSNIKKFNNPNDKSTSMVVNMEAGNFGSRRIGTDMPMTKWDHELNQKSNNPDNQILEKQISGMYLGEITRLVILDYIRQGQIFTSFKDSKLRLEEPYGFDTKIMSIFENDKTSDLAIVQKHLAEFGITKSTKEERHFVQKVAHLVAERAAALAATQLVGCIYQMGKENKEVVVAVDGSVFEKYPGFKTIMEHYLQLLLNHSKVRLVLAKDGSGVGAALASFIY